MRGSALLLVPGPSYSVLQGQNLRSYSNTKRSFSSITLLVFQPISTLK